MERTTSVEFVDWLTYLDMETNSFHREDYYLAQIATEVVRSRIENPRKVCIEDMLLKFESKKEGKLNLEFSEMEEEALIEERTKRSKAYWFGVLGVEE